MEDINADDFSGTELTVVSDTAADALTRRTGQQVTLEGGDTPEPSREIIIFGIDEGARRTTRNLFNSPD